MIKFNMKNYPNDFKKYFSFLVENYGFVHKENKRYDFNFIDEFQRGEIRVHFNYDIRDNFFYFCFIRGPNTVFPNDKDNENIKPFFLLVKKYEPNFDLKKIQPDDYTYLNALETNAELLKKYGANILKGYEWI